jgi:hypothetical protein
MHLLTRILLRSLFLLAAWGLRAADDIALVGLSDIWRYLGHRADAPIPERWQAESFDDSGWYSGPSGFGTTTYGESTRLPSTNGWQRVLLRTSFVVGDGPRTGRLSLRADYGGGFVAWLNGVEVARRGLPGLPGTQTPLLPDAAPRSAGSAELLDIGPAAGLLRAGTNVLAVQVHADNFYSFWPVFTAELLAGFTRAPYLQNVSSNRAEILFATPPGTTGRVEFGASTNLDRRVETPPGTRHLAVLEGLEPGRRYSYRTVVESPEGTFTSDVRSFRALPMSGPLTVQVIGDSGGADIWQHRVTERMAAEPADLLLHAGDIIYPSFHPDLTDIRFLSVQRPVMRQTPGFFAWGNHDLHYGTAPFLDVLRSATNDTPASEHLAERTIPESYYSFDAGDVHFVVLFQPFVTQYLMRPDGSQARWLERDLAATRKPWRVMISHVPTETSGLHRHDDFNFNGLRDSAEFSTALIPIARRHGVQLLLAGHDHNYERLTPSEGITAVVTGGGGGLPYGLRETDPRSAAFLVTYHYTRLRFEGDSLRIQCIDWQGRIQDDTTIHRTPPPVRIHDALAAPALVEPTGPSDGDGNLIGQAYDLAEAPAIPSFTGRRSTLGNLRVQMDADFLYLGLDGLGLTPGSDAYLFLEVPGLPGVGSLRGLGNGIPDAGREGADALDQGDAVAFSEFRPSIAMVVGDELADGTDRFFRRSGSTNGLGQGVFRLEPGFPALAGARLQQFNRSPQTGPVAPTESGAGFVEVALPLSALGGLGFGQEIRVGALVGLEWNGTGPARPFDNGFIGDSLVPRKSGGAALTGLRVRLPSDPDPDRDGLDAAEEMAAGTDPLRVDTDGDGLPDGWEVLHGTDALVRSETADPDNDGYSNGEEHRLGSSPTNPFRPLRVAAETIPGGGVRIAWRAGVGRRYSLESADELGGRFEPVEGFPRAAGVPDERIEVPTGGTLRFFRLRVFE